MAAMCGGLTDATISAVTIDKEAMAMEISALFARMPSPQESRAIRERICGEYGLSRVSLSPENKPPEPAKSVGKKRAAPGTCLYGKVSGSKITPMEGLDPDCGSVTVRGRVFAVDSRELTNRSAWVLGFDITDDTGSIHVSKYFRDEDDRGSLKDIQPGMYLTVTGRVGYNRYEEDINLEPRGVAVSPAPARADTAPEKRVELHLHTRYSALDALTDPAAAVKQAAAWGHKALAVTDHGVAQAFPEIWKAGKKNGVKIIYGVEGYYINDVDESPVMRGGDAELDGAFVVFDLETTGLSSRRDRITEIGAVILENGAVTGRFETFVNPGMPIPMEVSRLTGITDRDVFDAPSEDQAVRDFLAFAGDRPLIAHNAEFDIGFIREACLRCKIDFAPVYGDTLAMSRILLPELRRHKLDLVAARLGLPEFDHHRAADDAATTARILDRFLHMMREQGIESVGQLDRSETASGGRSRHTGHIILLVKNKTGLKNLYKLISKAHLEHFKRNPIIPKSLLMQHREGLIIGSACEAGEVFRAVTGHKSRFEQQRLARFYDYLEIQPLCNNAFMIASGQAAGEEDLRDFNRRIVELGKELGKPVVATGDVHFLHPEDEIYRHILLAAKKFEDADKSLPIYFKTTDEMLEEFSYLGEETAHEVVVGAPGAIADSCEEIELLPKTLFTPVIENSAEDLKSLVYGRLTELYGENPPELVKNRVDTEMNDICGCRYDVIYMSAQKLVADSLANGYLVGSRGSVGSSLVAYLSGVTEVNSLPAHYLCPDCKYADFASGAGFGCGADMPDAACPRCGARLKKEGFDIPFETFLGFGGNKVPDIDLNFSGEYQAKAHKYTDELFGKDHVFRAGTIGTLADKTAFGYVKKYLEEQGRTVTKAEERRLTAGCVGVKRTTGQHPGGLVIIPQDMEVTDFCPVQRPADDPDTDIVTTHFEYHSMEDNLLKLDVLGHDDPTMIRMLEDFTGVNAREIPLDDPQTMEIFRSPAPLGLPDDDPIIGKTGSIGIPEFGTGFTRGMLVDTQPKGFDTLVRLSGFSHGTDVWLGNAKDLILSGTATIDQTIGCRDDIMLYLISRGMEEKKAFKIMEAVRKGKGITPEQEADMKAVKAPAWYIDSCKKIKYLFPKAHAVAYVTMAFRIAWFKVHHPLAFYSAYFYRRSQKDSFDALVMTRGIDTVRAKIREIRAAASPTAKEEDLVTTLEAVYEFYLRGFSFETVDLYQSDATRFLIEGNCLRPPFVAVPGLGETTALDLVKNRAGRDFVSAEELMAACAKLSQSHLEQLRNLGALGDLPETSQMSFF